MAATTTRRHGTAAVCVSLLAVTVTRIALGEWRDDFEISQRERMYNRMDSLENMYLTLSVFCARESQLLCGDRIIGGFINPNRVDHDKIVKATKLVVLPDEDCGRRMTPPSPMLTLFGDVAFQSCPKPWEETFNVDFRVTTNARPTEQQRSTVKNFFRIPMQLIFQWAGGEPASKVTTVFLRSLLDSLDPLVEDRLSYLSDHNTTLLVLPEMQVVPRNQFSRPELVEILKEVVEEEVKPEAATKFGDLVKRLLGGIESAGEPILPRAIEPLSTHQRESLHPFYDGRFKPRCIAHVLERNYELSNSCPLAYRVALEKQEELEMRLQFPLARLLFWLYVLASAMILGTLSMDLGHRETKLQRRRRIFREQLEDPLLRKGIEQMAIKAHGSDETKVAAFMVEMDARSAKFKAEEDETDIVWKRQEARMEAWKARLFQLQFFRGILACALCPSIVLLIIDRPQIKTILEGVMVLLLAFCLTSTVLPESPQSRSKQQSGAAKPLLSDYDGKV